MSGASDVGAAQFTGRENDGTGLYYYRARYYSPSLQRFISEDPIGMGGGDLNLYAYVGNSPTNATDPNGEAAHMVVGAVVAGGGNLAYQLYQNGGNFGCVNWWEVGSWALGGSGAGIIARRGLMSIPHFFYDSRPWSTISRTYIRSRPGWHLDHWGIPRRWLASRGGSVPDAIGNAGWNLFEMPPALNTWLGFALNQGYVRAQYAQLARLGINAGLIGAAGGMGWGGYEIGTRAAQGRGKCQ